MNTMQAIKKIDDLYIEFFKRDFYNHPIKKINFEYQSYSRWTLNEIKQYLLQNKDRDPLELLDNFLYIMSDFACISKNGYANFIFSVACDITQFVIDEIRY